MELLLKEAAKIGVELTGDQMRKFETYKNLLLEWNKKFNLTAITDEKDIIIKHFADSLSVVKIINEKKLDLSNISMIDVGTGAGFPGIPAKIAAPEIETVLLDATKKKIGFLHEVIERLELAGIFCVHARAEEAGRLPEFRECFETAVSRAVAPLGILAEYCLPFVKTGGFFFALKGPEAEREVDEAENVIVKLGGETEGIEKAFISGDEIKHYVVVVKKIKKTPETYPRENRVIKRGAR